MAYSRISRLDWDSKDQLIYSPVGTLIIIVSLFEVGIQKNEKLQLLRFPNGKSQKRVSVSCHHSKSIENDDVMIFIL